MKTLALLALVACNPPDRGPKFHAAGHAQPVNGGTLRFATKDQVRTLDPAIAYEEVSSYAVHALYDTLVDYDVAKRGDDASGFAVVPHLAAHYEVSSDGLEYHFWLRDGIAFSDGTPVVADDFLYSFDRTLSRADSPFIPNLLDIEGAKDVVAKQATHCAGITAPSPREVVIRLEQRNMAFLVMLTMSFATPQRRTFVEQVGDEIQSRALGTGPFVLEQWDQGRRLVLARNPHYWDAAAIHLDRIELVENTPRDTQFLMFERGELDSAERLAAPDYLWIIDQKDWAPYVEHRPVMNAYGSRMNVRVKPFDDRRVRQALNYATNKDHELKLLNGAAVASHGVMPPGIFGRDDSIPPYPHDPAKARALLAEAGYPNGFDTDYVIMNDDEAERLASSLQGDLAEVGVRMHISIMSFATYATAIGSKDGPAFSKGSWLGDFADPINFLDARFSRAAIADENSVNDSFYSNPELERLLADAHGEADRGTREGLYHRAERILYDDAPWIWEYHQEVTEVIQPYVAGYSLHPIWMRDYTRAWLDR
ncbi:MAG: ABC transporter substrate-binding protein [Kofleriaceae bacterium]